MSLKKDQVVTVNFTLKDEGGNVIEATTKEQPFAFISGAQQILPKLESSIGEMIIGGNKEVVLQPEEAYGNYEKDALQVVNRSEFPEGTKIEEGMEYIADTPNGGQMPFVIKNVDGDNITLDFNHPLAGKALTFEVELLDLRDATDEELSHGHVHGAGGHHH